MKKILLVEDNLISAKGLKYLLEREKIDVTISTNAKDAKSALCSQFDLIILDISLPDQNGFGLAEFIRNENIPIIFLTAYDDEASVVRGLNLGAEDYITKPFRNRELISRINNVFRRHEHLPTKITYGDISLDSSTSKISVKNRVVQLSALELRILSKLLENRGKITTRDQLLDEIWETTGNLVDNNTISVYVKRIREKLQTDQIKTIKNIGYRLEES